MKAPPKGIAALRSFFSGNEENDGDLNPFQLTHKQEDVLKNLRQRITVYVDKKTQVVTLGVSMQDPLISADVAHSIVIKLQTYITHTGRRKQRKIWNLQKSAKRIPQCLLQSTAGLCNF